MAVDFALDRPARVGGLVLVDAAGLGPELAAVAASPLLPGVGEFSAAIASMPAMWIPRVAARMAALFARPDRVPVEWIVEQLRLASRPWFVWNGLYAARSQAGPFGQAPIRLGQLGQVRVPTLVDLGPARPDAAGPPGERRISDPASCPTPGHCRLRPPAARRMSRAVRHDPGRVPGVAGRRGCRAARLAG